MSSIDMQHLTAPNEKQNWATKYGMLIFVKKKKKRKEWAQSIVLYCQVLWFPIIYGHSCQRHTMLGIFFNSHEAVLAQMAEGPTLWEQQCTNDCYIPSLSHEPSFWSSVSCSMKTVSISWWSNEHLFLWWSLQKARSCLWRCPQSFHFLSRLRLHISSTSSNRSCFLALKMRGLCVSVCCAKFDPKIAMYFT